jgi:hypothetical protein
LSFGEYKRVKACEDLKLGALPGSFYSTQRAVTSATNIVILNIIH